MDARRIGLLGYGEVGQRFAADLRAAGAQRELATFDLLLHQAAAGEAMRRHAATQRVDLMTDAAALADETTLIFSAVTADQTLNAARSLAERNLEHAVIVDVNSAAPQTKVESAALVAAAGGRYVEAAVMASVPPHGIRVPMLLGGAHAAVAEKTLAGLGFAARAVSNDLGVASAIKLCRSVIIKGLESLTVESMRAARHFGAEEQVLASLNQTFPGIGWGKELPDYLVSRVAEHGRRRAAEMREVARTLEDAGFESTMASATARLQDALVDEMHEHGIAYAKEEKFSWREFADALTKK